MCVKTNFKRETSQTGTKITNRQTNHEQKTNLIRQEVTKALFNNHVTRRCRGVIMGRGRTMIASIGTSTLTSPDGQASDGESGQDKNQPGQYDSPPTFIPQPPPPHCARDANEESEGCYTKSSFSHLISVASLMLSGLMTVPLTYSSVLRVLELLSILWEREETNS